MHWKLSLKKNVLTSRACVINHRFWDINEKLWNCVKRNTHYASFKLKVKRIIKPPIENKSVQLQNKISSNKETYTFHALPYPTCKNKYKTGEALISTAILTIPCCRGESSFSISRRARSSFPTGWLVKATSWRTTLSPREIPVMSTAFTSGPITCP